MQVLEMPDTNFRDMMERARGGDREAAARLVSQYEPEIRRAIRIRTVEPRLQRFLDSADICQSVMRRFLGALRAAEVPSEDPRQLLAWLVRVARNRMNLALRRLRVIQQHLEQAARDAAERTEADADPDHFLDAELANRELLDLVLHRLTPEERHIADSYANGASWDDLARELGCGKEALRKRFMRALQRVVAELGL
jgi:RNA polymerase sigma factor (sigma-70 family)